MIEMNLKEYKATQKKSKYKNKKFGQFDSKKEEKRYNELLIMQAAGEISGLNHHTQFELIPKQPGERAVNYEADFTYIQVKNNAFIVEDVKSPATRKIPAYIIKRKLMLWLYGIKITEV